MSDNHEDQAPPPRDLSGQNLGGYLLLRRLGRGAMAEVYLAVQTSLKRKVAIKVLRPEFANDATYVARFRREAESAASLVHANIVQIYEVGRLDDIHFIAQEYVQGENLRQWMRRNGNPTAAQALAIISQAAAGLARAGEKKLVHRDIKPENILITKDGEVKVADFGLARQAFDETGESLALTRVGMTLGTPLYMSPEQAEGRKLDPRSDIYSLGVTCYHLLTGTPPFDGDTALAVAVKHLKNIPVPLKTLRPDLPDKLCDIVHKMLAKKPDERYASATDLLQELIGLQATLPSWKTGTLPAGGLLAETLRCPETPPSIRKSRAMKVALWALLGLIAAFLGGLLAHAEYCGPQLATEKSLSRVVPRKDKAEEQWAYAVQVGTEDAWEAVIKYHPGSEEYTKRARQQLARIYLLRGSRDKAKKIFDDLAEDEDEEHKAFGLAGQACIFALEKKYDEASTALAEFAPISRQLRDPDLRHLVWQVAQKVRSERSEAQTAQFDDLLAELLNDDFPAPPLDEPERKP